MEVVQSDGTVSCALQDVLAEWKDKFSGLLDTSAKSNSPTYEYRSVHNVYDTNTLNESISLEEVLKVIINAKSGKAPGVDEIPVEVYKNVSVITTLGKLFNTCFQSGLVPSSWGNSIICPIPKSAMGDKRGPLQYRETVSVAKVFCNPKMLRQWIRRMPTDPGTSSTRPQAQEQQNYPHKPKCKRRWRNKNENETETEDTTNKQQRRILIEKMVSAGLRKIRLEVDRRQAAYSNDIKEIEKSFFNLAMVMAQNSKQETNGTVAPKAPLGCLRSNQLRNPFAYRPGKRWRKRKREFEVPDPAFSNYEEIPFVKRRRITGSFWNSYSMPRN
ncbi:hypothetical protein ScPMuIL_012397 [Solemya velum]